MVQVYVHDLVSSVTQPVRLLKAFQRVTTGAGALLTLLPQGSIACAEVVSETFGLSRVAGRCHKFTTRARSSVRC